MDKLSHILIENVLAPEQSSSGLGIKGREILVFVSLVKPKLVAHANRNCSMAKEVRVVAPK